MPAEPHHLKRQPHAKALWALGWRMVLLSPVVAVVGLLALTLVLALSIGPPLVAVFWVVTGDFLWALAALVVWVVWLRFGGRLRRLVLEGFEQGSM